MKALILSGQHHDRNDSGGPLVERVNPRVRGDVLSPKAVTFFALGHPRPGGECLPADVGGPLPEEIVAP